MISYIRSRLGGISKWFTKYWVRAGWSPAEALVVPPVTSAGLVAGAVSGGQVVGAVVGAVGEAAEHSVVPLAADLPGPADVAVADAKGAAAVPRTCTVLQERVRAKVMHSQYT